MINRPLFQAQRCRANGFIVMNTVNGEAKMAARFTSRPEIQYMGKSREKYAGMFAEKNTLPYECNLQLHSAA